MKTIFSVAALAAAALAFPVLAQDAPGGHYEWQSRQVPGPNKSGTIPRTRVWVKDGPMQMAGCDGGAAEADRAGCAKKAAGGRKAHPAA